MTLFGLVGLGAQVNGYVATAGTSEAARQAFSRQMEPLALQLAYLFPLPQRTDTLGGYITWRAYPALAIFFTIWAVIAAAGAVRGEEEHGVLGAWLSAGMGRMRYVAIRTVTFAVVLAVAIAIASLAGWGLSHSVGLPLAAADMLGEGVALWALAFAWFGISVLLAQFASSRGGANGIGLVVLVALFFGNSLARTAHSLDGIARLSPFHLFDQTNSLVPGGHFDVTANLVLVAVGVVASAAGALAFSARDLDAPLVRFEGRARGAVRQASTNPLLRVPVLNRLWQWRGMLLAWMVGAVLFASLMTSVAHSTSDLIRNNPAVRDLLRASNTDPAVSLIAFGWFSLATFGLAVLAILRTADWSSEDTGGRLELELAQPLPRWRVVVDRALELGIAALLVGTAGSLAVALEAPGQNVHIDLGRLALATALLVPVALSFGGLGAAISAWAPRVAVTLLTALAAVAFFLQDLGPLFRWPDWLLNLSIFQLYGRPMVDSVYWNGFWGMVAIIVVGFLVAIAAMQRREVGR